MNLQHSLPFFVLIILLLVTNFPAFSRELLYTTCHSKANIRSEFLPVFQQLEVQREIIPTRNAENGEWSLEFPRSNDAKFIATCSGKGNTLKYFGKASISAWCDSNGNIQTEYGVVALEKLICSRLTAQTIAKNGTCQPINDGTRITITPANYDALSNSGDCQINCCFNDATASSYYCHHYMDGKNYVQPGTIERPSFKEGGIYPTMSVDTCYTKATQTRTIEERTGLSASDYIQADNTDYSLVRGHLACNADFCTPEGRGATFYFVNVVPQWQKANGGNWFRLEEAIRNWGILNKCTLEIYTGVIDILEKKDINGVNQKLYLGRDSSTDKMVDCIPVPREMFKIVVCKELKKGVVCFQINEIYDTYSEGNHRCTDVTSQLTWINWNAKDSSQGYTYCCYVDGVVITNLPSFNGLGLELLT